MRDSRIRLMAAPGVTIVLLASLVLLVLLLLWTTSSSHQTSPKVGDTRNSELPEMQSTQPIHRSEDSATDYCSPRSADSWFAVTDEFCHMQEQEIQLTNDDGQTITIKVRLADEPFERFAGYQYIGPGVIGNTFVLFVFEDDITGQFHMRNVYAPLDIAFIQNDGKVIDTQLMIPGQELYGPEALSFRYVLEARMGYYGVHSISAGNSRLILNFSK